MYATADGRNAEATGNEQRLHERRRTVTLHEPIQSPPPADHHDPRAGGTPPPADRGPVAAGRRRRHPAPRPGRRPAARLSCATTTAERHEVASSQAGFTGPAIAIGRGSDDLHRVRGQHLGLPGWRERVLRDRSGTGTIVPSSRRTSPIRCGSRRAPGRSGSACPPASSAGSTPRDERAAAGPAELPHGARGDRLLRWAGPVWTGADGGRTIEVLDAADGHFVDSASSCQAALVRHRLQAATAPCSSCSGRHGPSP